MIPEATRSLVRQRAGERCEYCQLAQKHSPVARLQIEHVRPRKHGGGDDASNLALACIDCNLKKGVNLVGIDPLTEGMETLFNPRTQNWAEHFRWNGPRIEGVTGIGRTTVRVLELNSPDRVQVRIAIGMVGTSPKQA